MVLYKIHKDTFRNKNTIIYRKQLQTMKICYNCNTPLTESNITEEHIILNAIGGKLKSKELICRRCNSEFGDSSDKALAKALQPFSTLLDINRNRGSNPSFIMRDQENKEFRIGGPGSTPILHHPYIDVKNEGDKKSVRMTVKNIDELEKILQGKIKSGELNQAQVDIIIEKARKQINEHHPELNFTVSIPQEAFPSIIKSAVNYYIFLTDDNARIKPMIPYVKGEKDPTDILCIITPEILPYVEDSKHITHMLHIEGSSRTGLLYCMLEYFSVYHYLVQISDSYEGPDINDTYCYDVISDRTIQRNFSWEIDKAEFNNQREQFYHNPCYTAVTKRFERLMSHYRDKDRKACIENIIQDVFGQHPGESVFTPQICNELTERLIDKLIRPFM